MYIVTVTFLAALLPNAVADLSTIVGAACYVGLDLIFPLLMWNTAKRPARALRVTHIVVAVAWGAVAVGATGAAVWDIAHRQAGSLEFFGDVQGGG